MNQKQTDNFQSEPHKPDSSAQLEEENLPLQQEEIKIQEQEKTGGQHGVLKYYKGGDYFLAGTDTAHASKQKGEQAAELEEQNKGATKQGTLMGVFFPVLQNILGVLLFIRVPAITGEAGIRDSILIVLICCTTTFLTTLSLSAIATNGKISQGGTYYLLSRSLGAPIGTAVGFSFYLGTTAAGAMYILGAAESFIVSTKLEIVDFQVSMRIYGTILLVTLISINLIGLKYVGKTGIVFLMVVLLSVFSMYIGIFTQNARDPVELEDIEPRYAYAEGITGMSYDHWDNNWLPRYQNADESFFFLLSVYFPSVTGIMAGSNRSGDLADPSRSIPRGTLGAQFTTTIIYLSFPMLFGAVADRNTLQTELSLIAAEVSWPTKYLIIVGIILSSTGAGLQCLAGAPRLFLAIADDDNLPCFKVFKNGMKKIIVLTGFICFLAVMIGDINAITPIITMFFLLCYGFVNLCCLFLDTVAFPNWRPSWKFYHKFFSFLGLSLCIFLMIAISWWSFLIALGLAALLFTIVIKNKKINDNYGDSIEAVKLATAKNSLIGLISSSKHVKNWIPIVLVIGDYDDKKKHDQQVEAKGGLFFLNTIKKDVSFIIYGNSIEGNYTLEDCQKMEKNEKGLEKWLNKEKLQVIPKVVQVQKQAKDLPHSGMLYLMQAAGLGGLEPNTIMMKFPLDYKSNPERAERFVQFVSYGVRFGKAIIATVNDDNFAPKMEVILEKDQENQSKEDVLPNRTKQQQFKQSIDVWSFSYEKGLMILLTYFLSRSYAWKNCKINLYIVTLQQEGQQANKEEETKRVQQKVQEFLNRYRLIPGKINVFVELIEFDQWKQVEGLMLTQARHDQMADHPDQFKKAKVDPSSNYGMNLDEVKAKEVQKPGQGAQKPERALSVMSTAQVKLLNDKITSKSKESDLVILNLPEPVNQNTFDYLTYLQNMSAGLKRVLMVRNDGQECITEFT